MLNIQQKAFVDGYLRLKVQISQFNNQMMSSSPRRPVPKFATPYDACQYYAVTHGNIYTGDPFYGVVDIYTHPERVQAAIEIGPEQIKKTFIDCDDVACWYYAALLQMPGYTPKIITLIDSNVVGSHVLCGYTAPDGHFGVLDTNGLHYLLDLKPTTLCALWNEIYKDRGYNYIDAVDCAYPFAA